LDSRGVDDRCQVNFHSWKPNPNVQCPKFKAHFGEQGESISNHLITSITSPRGEIIGLECRKFIDGEKKVRQYRTQSSQWNPYVLGAEKAFQTLWEGGDLWVVEGMFDKVALDRVLPSCDASIATLRAGMDTITQEMVCRYWTPASTIYLCYDNDETGRKKSEALTKAFKWAGVRAVSWRYRGKDPNEVWQFGGDPLLKKMFLI
jgi:DNA primase